VPGERIIGGTGYPSSQPGHPERGPVELSATGGHALIIAKSRNRGRVGRIAACSGIASLLHSTSITTRVIPGVRPGSRSWPYLAPCTRHVRNGSPGAGPG